MLTTQEYNDRAALLTPMEQRLLKIIEREEYYNREEAAEEMSVSTSHVSGMLNSLKKLELVLRTPIYKSNKPV